MSSAAHLFLYGSWSPDQVHYPLLQADVLQWREGFLRGSVYRSTVGFPVFVAWGEDRVAGVIATVDSTARAITIMDRVHGLLSSDPERLPYERFSMKAMIREGEAVPVTVYGMTKARLPAPWPRIPKGNWRRDLHEKPDLVSRLPEAHRNFLARLGASNDLTGEEILDLALYRDLLKMNLIIDSGRQVGLSDLGYAVYRALPQEAIEGGH